VPGGIAVLDYGIGNLASAHKALVHLGARARLVTDPAEARGADGVVLPGVGAFGRCAQALRASRLDAVALDAVANGVPFLGICLGLQVLFESSEEAPQLRGLNLLPGKVCALPSIVKLPHMGWNQLAAKGGSRLPAGIAPGAYFYFAHSYAAHDSNGIASATCTHGAPFIAVLEKQNICAVQFHPEKSGASGAQLLQNFLRMAA